MNGVAISDEDDRGALDVSLPDILQLIGSAAAKSTWTVGWLECSDGEEANALYEVADNHLILTGARLMELARPVLQIIEGTFSGRLQADEAPWIVIRFIDSTYVTVETDAPGVLAAIRARYRLVEALSQ